MKNLVRDDAILRDAAEARRLSGLSGAQVYLMTRDGRHWFVRKVANQPEASARLRIQAEKQRALGDEMQELISTPRILDENEIDGRYYFDMEFVRGPDGMSYLRRASYAEVAQLCTRLCRYLEAAAERPALLAANHGTFFDALYAKISDVQRTLGLISEENLSLLFLALDRMRQLDHLSPTLCHGDLTLQNIVVGDNHTLWVLDLLDSPFEHYWQDVAKLHQDLSGGWFLLEQAPVSQCVLDYISGRLLEAATRLHPEYPRLHALLVASTFVRILPYARTAEETRFITERINYFAARTVEPAAKSCKRTV